MSITDSPRMTLQERRLLRYIPEAKSLSEAMRKAGYAESTIQKNPTAVLRKNRVKSAFMRLLDREGITDKRLAQKLSQGLDCKKVIAANVIIKDNQSDTSNLKDATSVTKDFLEVDDNTVQHKYLETALKLKDKFPAAKQEITQVSYEQRLQERIYEQEQVEEIDITEQCKVIDEQIDAGSGAV